MPNKTFDEQRTAAEKLVDAAVKERILRGLDVLREYYGEDWVDHIDPGSLDLSSSTRCVLGQLEDFECGGDFHTALERIDGEVEVTPEAYGFDTEWGSDSYEELTEAWLTVAGLEA